MPSLGGITEIIGIRAEIIGIRQYLADGRQIESLNERIASSTKKIEDASVSLQKAEAAKFAASKKANADFLAASAARQRVIQAETALQANAAKIAAKPPAATGLVGVSGQPISSATTGANVALIAEQAKLKESLKTAKAEFADLARVAVISGRLEAAAESEATAADESHTAAIRQQAIAEAQLADARRSRIKTAATVTALATTAVIGVTAGAAITQAAKYQQELSKINVLTNATDEQTQQLGQSFLKLSTEIPVSASDLAAAAYKLLSSGIKDTGQALDITTQAAKAAVAGQADIKDIISATIAVLNGYPKGAITATQANDILFAGVKEGAAEFNDFSGSIGKLIPIAAALGVPFDQLTASLAVLTNGGLNAEEAATGLRAILNDLAKDEGSKQAADALRTVGLTVEQLRRNIVEKGLPQAMGELINLFKGNLAAIEPVIPNIRGMVAAYSAFSDSGKTTTGVLNSIDNSAGIVNNSFEKVKNNTANVAKIFSNTLNVALIEIGSAILPSVTKALQDLVTWFQANREGIQQFVSQGLQAIIDIGRDAASGIAIIAKVLGELSDIFKSIVGNSAATQAALAAIGVSLAWALPGGPLIVGLTSILILLGQIQNAAGGGSKSSTGRAIVQGVSTAIGAVGGGLLGSLSATPFGVGAGALGGAAVGSIGGKALSDLLFGAEDNKNIQNTSDVLKQTNSQIDQLGKITLPPLKVNIGGVDQAAKQAAEDLKKFAQEFKKASEALGETDSITKDLQKFGQGLGIVQISLQDANKAKLSASQAGEVAGLDAEVRALERAQSERFNYIEAVTAITKAWQLNASVGRALAEELAQSALSANQTALSNLFSRPTREVANLGVPLAQQQLTTARLRQNADPRIFVLQQQLRDIDKQITRQNQINTLANRNAERAKRDQERAQKAQQEAAQDTLDALKLANLQAQIAAERQLAALQKLIDANNKAASDLQAAFLKSNEALQVQINTAIGKGDSTTALALVDQQRAATKQYREQSKALQNSTQNLTAQQKAAQEAEAERQRQAQLAEAQAQASKKQQKSTEDLTSSIDDNKEAQDAQTKALEDSKQAIQDQIEALQRPIDASQEQEKVIQDNIAVFEAQTNILKAMGVAADQTLLTQKQQKEAAEHFTAQIEYASGQAQALAKSFYDFIPGAHEADLSVQALRGAMDSVKTKIDTVLNPGFDAAAARLDLFKKAIEDATTSYNNSTVQTNQNLQTTNQAMADWQTAQEQILAAENDARSGFTSSISNNKNLLDKAFETLRNSITSAGTSIGSSLLKSIGGLFKGKIPGLAVGGIVTNPTLALVGESGPEAILPLNDPARIGQILNNIRTIGGGGDGGLVAVGPSHAYPSNITTPSSITSALLNRPQSSAVFAPNITVTGETLDTMEATALAAVRAAFRDARLVSGRTGGLITTGLGPSH